eukprot:2348221-Pyramimonas_sp.AAC.1
MIAELNIQRGCSWTVAERMSLPNADGAVAGVALRNGNVMVVFNNNAGRRNPSVDMKQWPITAAMSYDGDSRRHHPTRKRKQVLAMAQTR